MGTLDNKVAIVTGGGSGVGRGIALALASEGARVAVCGRTEATLAAVSREIDGRGVRGLPIVCDVTELDELRAMVDRVVSEFGTVDILVNNAMIVPRGDLLEIDEETIDAGWRSGPLATLRLMRLCHSYLRDGGAIINVSSGVSLASTVPMRGVYAAVKSAVNALSRHAAVEWGPDGIRVNTIMPVARTEALDAYFDASPGVEEAMQQGLPLGRIGEPEADIGRVAVFLAGPDAGYVTGVAIPVDGGGAYLR